MWELKDLIEHCDECNTEINGQWIPARPINFKYYTLGERLELAWAVFIGKADAFKWPEGQ